jgi:hypothetical protein
LPKLLELVDYGIVLPGGGGKNAGFALLLGGGIKPLLTAGTVWLVGAVAYYL